MSEIRPSLKRLHSPDIDLESFFPEEDDCFGFLLQAFFAPGEGESFDIFICTPKWLERNMKEGDILSGRHYLFVKRYDLEAIRRYLQKWSQHCGGANWREVAQKLSRLGGWEFEDYKL
jgi:hypothetical protein